MQGSKTQWLVLTLVWALGCEVQEPPASDLEAARQRRAEYERLRGQGSDETGSVPVGAPQPGGSTGDGTEPTQETGGSHPPSDGGAPWPDAAVAPWQRTDGSVDEGGLPDAGPWQEDAGVATDATWGAPDASGDGSSANDADAAGDSEADASTEQDAGTGADASMEQDANMPGDAGDGDAFEPVYAILAARCAPCHAAGRLLDLSDKMTAYVSLVNSSAAIGQCGVEGHTRVIPYDADQSLVIQKLEGTPPCGGAMPANGPALEPALIGIIRDWIDRGAPYEEPPES